MSHITDLHIQQFRGLRNLHLSEMGQINLLVGGNNSGKTSVLEAIATYCRPLDPWEWITAARSREIKSSRISMLESFTWLFPQAASNSANGLYQGQIVMTGNGDVPVREVVATLHEILVESMQENTSGYDDERFDETPVIVRGADVTVHAKMNMRQRSLFSNNGDMTETMTFQLREDERFVQRKKSNAPMLAVNTMSSHAHRVEQLQIQRLSETALQELQLSAVEMLQTFDSGVEGIEIWSQSGVRPTLYIRL